MLDLMKKTMMAGIGLALKTKDEVEELAREMIKKGEMPELEGKKFLEDLLKLYDETRSKLEDRVETLVRHFLKKADVVTGDELKQLKKEIIDLKKAVSRLAKDKNKAGDA